MDYTQANLGRTFILRLHQNERLHEVIENFAAQQQIKSAICFFLGGAENKSKIVVGPKDGNAMPPQPMTTLLQGVHEAHGTGTIFTNQEGKPTLHMHASFGRNNNTTTGCTRMGVNIWHIGEVIILELTDTTAKRTKNKQTGFELLEC
jgi:predicted DNA-binding protein with PD1-like motif